MVERQKTEFLSTEANNWFNRNKNNIESYDPNKDFILNKIQSYKIRPNSVLEIGCADGYRLNELRKRYSCFTFGVEPSIDAVEYGNKHYDGVTLFVGTSDELGSIPDSSIDLIILNFVFHWIDRDLLLKSCAEIDRVLINDGILMIGDFFPGLPEINTYHHPTLNKVYTFKQDYESIFLSTKLYSLVDKSSYNHSKKDFDFSNDFHNRFSVSILKRTGILNYKNNS